MIARLRAQLASPCHDCRVRLVTGFTFSRTGLESACRDVITQPMTDINDPIHTVRYLTDDRDHTLRHELCITMGGNGDWYVSVVKEGDYPTTGVRICTSGGAASKVPGLGVAIANAFRAMLGKTRPEPRQPKRYISLTAAESVDLTNDESNYMEIESHKLSADDDGYRWVPNPVYDQASYEYDPATGQIRKRHE